MDFLIGLLVVLSILMFLLVGLFFRYGFDLGKGIVFKTSSSGEDSEAGNLVEEVPQILVPEVLPDISGLSEVPEVVEPEVEAYEISLLGVGDNLIHTIIYLQAAGRGTDGGYDFTYTYENVAPYIERVDIASINQETMLSRSNLPSSYPLFNTPVEMARDLKKTGFDVVNLANNHMFDKGETGLRETIELLTEEHEMVVVGAYLSEDSYLEIPVITVEGVDIAFVGTSQTTNGLYLPSSSRMIGSVTADEGDIPAFLEQVKRAKGVADVVVANIHWGSEYTHNPTDFQKNFAELAIEAGVDVIFGHHPHVIQPVEYIEREDGTFGVVCYSLGNFVSGQDQRSRMLGGMMDVRLTVAGEDISIETVTFYPCITHYGNKLTNLQVFPYDMYTAELADSHGISTLNMNYIYDTVTRVIGEEFIPEDFYEIYAYE